MSRKTRIEELINQELDPAFLNVEDESSNHHVPEGAQTHFKITLVSSRFIGLSRIARHRLLNQLLKEEFELGLHALSMHLFTPDEWENRSKAVLQSPVCKGGFNKEKRET
ncbi:BolA family protein [Legionella anisa]|uniref:BolA family transcriptional regulator n=1 Tax=Legionella anisa TaxID=28082 RepID=A0AAX0WS63_9GAMM|nr:BolA family protein [Legionella anisa]AWN74627.1 BolA family transcriptional regulator [Legionella anisa]KTC76235.1 regulator of penicillin binding proteins and beta lactamase transcription (morphogene) [Legionella anisa]MCW8425255.1 BolA family transcriptional regulator [Legionella anisa]MCW8449315.1 BolA family transcriptional regulator [Legionella anisa]PNL61478.1 BolA family transcriptional regulator [Legionella anisa]